jgi:hypothetical protein
MPFGGGFRIIGSMRTLAFAALLALVGAAEAMAAPPVPGGHYIVHTTPRPSADAPKATVLHVFRHGDEFTEVSWMLSEDRYCNFGEGGYGPFWLNRTAEDPPLKITRDGAFAGTRRQVGVDARGRHVSSTVTIRGRFVSRRIARGWFSETDGPYPDGQVCWSGKVAFRAVYSRALWRRVPKWEQLPASSLP